METYLTWMRYALWGGEKPETPASLSLLLDIANRQKTRGLIYDALLREATGLPDERRSRMQYFLLQTFNTHRQLDAAVARSMAALQEAGIPAVLLKGQGVARNYPNPLLRECGDVDVYIGPERFEAACQVLRGIADRADDAIYGKHWQFWIGEAEVELHLYSIRPETRRQLRFYRELEANGFAHGLVTLDFQGVSVPTPAPTFNAFYLFYHAWHHFLDSGIGLRQLCDWALLLHAQRDAIDRERLRAMLDGMQLLRPWQLFGCIAVHDLGLPAEEFPCYDEASLPGSRRLLEIIIKEGNFGHASRKKSKRPSGLLPRKVHSFGRIVRRFFRLLPAAPGVFCRSFWQITTYKLLHVFQRGL